MTDSPGGNRSSIVLVNSVKNHVAHGGRIPCLAVAGGNPTAVQALTNPTETVHPSGSDFHDDGANLGGEFSLGFRVGRGHCGHGLLWTWCSKFDPLGLGGSH